MDEQGTISKANLIRGAILISGAGVAIKKAKATTVTIDAGILARLSAFSPGSDFGDGTTCSPGPHRPGMEGNVGPYCTAGGSNFDGNNGEGVEIGKSCNADVGMLGQASEDGIEFGGEDMVWFCGRADCSWMCTTGDGTDTCTSQDISVTTVGAGAGCPSGSNNKHQNCGTLMYKGFGPMGYGGHRNRLQFTHEAAEKGIMSTHSHAAGHFSFSEMGDCPGTVEHTNVCSHSSSSCSIDLWDALVGSIVGYIVGNAPCAIAGGFIADNNKFL